LRAMAKKITSCQAAEIIGISDRSMRRWRQRYEEHGYDGLFDRRRGKPGPKRVPLARTEDVLRLYQEKYAGLHVVAVDARLRIVALCFVLPLYEKTNKTFALMPRTTPIRERHFMERELPTPI